MARKGAKRKTKIDNRLPPTREAGMHGDFEPYYAEGSAKYRRVPVIDTLFARQQINAREHQALAFYRDQATLAERSPLKSCLDQRNGGGGDIGVSAAVASAMLTVSRIERDLGALRPIARAVAVEDCSLSQWCVDQHGGRERYDGKGRFVAIVPSAERRVMQQATLELKMAAHRIVA